MFLSLDKSILCFCLVLLLMCSKEEGLGILKTLHTMVKLKKNAERAEWAIFTLEFVCHIEDFVVCSSSEVVDGVFNIRAKATREIGNQLYRNIERTIKNKIVSSLQSSLFRWIEPWNEYCNHWKLFYVRWSALFSQKSYMRNLAITKFKLTIIWKKFKVWIHTEESAE